MAAGRHRAFDKEEALESAMLVFWQNGYVGTSLADLTQAMGINKPSMYAAFGNKEQLFMSALEQYVGQYNAPYFAHLIEPNKPLKERFYTYMRAVAGMLCHPDFPPGCMMINSTSESVGRQIPEEAHNLITRINENVRQQLTDFFAEEQHNGRIHEDRSPKTLALYLLSVNSGMAVLARSGATVDELDGVIQHVVETIV